MPHWLSWLNGSVRIECEGGYPERFLNAAAEQNIPLWDIRRQEASLFCTAPAAAYRQLRPAARYGQVRMRARERHGLPFRLRRFRLRWGLAAGFLLFLWILQALSSHVWIIRVTGNHTVPESAIREVLSPLGVREGRSFKTVDLANVQLTALQQLPELIWLTVNQSGSIVTVEVRERASLPPVADTAPANLVAVCDGVVLRVDAVTGQAVVRPGDAVTRGTLLISGVMDSKVGPQLKRATGSVIARTEHTLRVSVPLTESITGRTERTVTRPSLYVLGLRIPLYSDDELPGNPTVTTEHYPLMANRTALPVGMTVTRCRYQATDIVQHTPEQATALAKRRLLPAEQALRAILHVESRVIHVEQTADAVVVTAVYRGTQELTLSEPILQTD